MYRLFPQTVNFLAAADSFSYKRAAASSCRTSATNAARELLQNRECTLSREKNFCSYALRKGQVASVGTGARNIERNCVYAACDARADAAAPKSSLGDITASAIYT